MTVYLSQAVVGAALDTLDLHAPVDGRCPVCRVSWRCAVATNANRTLRALRTGAAATYELPAQSGAGRKGGGPVLEHRPAAAHNA